MSGDGIYVGIEKGYIIVINTDPDAFIMSRADVAVERDYRKYLGVKKISYRGGNAG